MMEKEYLNEIEYNSIEITSDDELNYPPLTNNDDDNPLFDYYQNIARASFDDMVHDEERNKLFYLAIEKSIKKIHSQNREVLALDIGSGTGLLSMMAIKAGAKRVLACECFQPIALCSKKILRRNNMSDCIELIAKRSSEINLTTKPNLLIAELLDTELIGEGCLLIYRDAINRIVEPDALFVPSRGRIWIQLVQSEYLFFYHQFQKYYKINDEIKIKPPSKILNCFGSHILHDLQMNRLKLEKDFEILTDPVLIFEFEFNNLQSLKEFDHHRIKLILKRKFDKPMMLLCWWDIDLDYEGDITLSCAPYWARPDCQSYDQLAWREHWMQTIYHLPAFAFNDEEQIDGFDYDQINKNKSLLIDAFHDQFSFWFDLPDQVTGKLDEKLSGVESWSCICGFHSHLSPSRLKWLNNLDRYKKYYTILDSIIKENYSFSICKLVYFGDESILPLLCSLHPQVLVIFIIVKNPKSYQFFKKFVIENKLNQKVKICSYKSFGNYRKQIDGIITDLHFRNNDVLFPSLEFFNDIKQYQYLSSMLNNKCLFSIPHRIVLRCLLVQFKHLWKCFAPVKTINVSGDQWNLQDYDQLIEESRSKVDWQIEPRYLWEYHSLPLIFKPIDLFELNLLNQVSDTNLEKFIEINIEHLLERIDKINSESIAIVCWFDQHLIKDSQHYIIRGGLAEEKLSFDTEIQWVRDQPQTISFLNCNSSDINQWENLIQNTKPTINLKFNLSLPKCSLKFEKNY